LAEYEHDGIGYVNDHLGSVLALVDSSGSVVESYQYDAWGNVLGVYDSSNQPINESSIGNRYLWQGREYSWKTGLYYFRARWYDPVTGRWLSNDPIGISGGLNQYVFCADDPVNCVDPTGLDAKTVLIPFGFSFSYHVPFTKNNPGEIAHERQHRKDWATDRTIPGWKMEQRAFAAEISPLRKRIKELKAKKCLTEAEKNELFDSELALIEAISIARSDAAAKAYWNSNRRWWQKPEEVKW
jgi:RHS repeat-associated protein